MMPALAEGGIVIQESTQRYVVLNAEFLVILGVLMAMLGVIALASPMAAGLAVELVVGIMLISRGSMQLYYGIKVRHWGEGLGSYMGLGSIAMSFVSVACGVLLLAHPLVGLNYLTLLLAAYLVITGGFDLLHSFELRFVSAWPLVSVSGLLSIVCGIMIWQQWPLSGAWAVGVAVGASLLVSGLSLSGLGMTGRWTRIQQAQSQQA
jgi:uncharacterized membrane protein HdeD (DUF308 family)